MYILYIYVYLYYVTTFDSGRPGTEGGGRRLGCLNKVFDLLLCRSNSLIDRHVANPTTCAHPTTPSAAKEGNERQPSWTSPPLPPSVVVFRRRLQPRTTARPWLRRPTRRFLVWISPATRLPPHHFSQGMSSNTLVSPTTKRFSTLFSPSTRYHSLPVVAIIALLALTVAPANAADTHHRHRQLARENAKRDPVPPDQHFGVVSLCVAVTIHNVMTENFVAFSRQTATRFLGRCSLPQSYMYSHANTRRSKDHPSPSDKQKINLLNWTQYFSNLNNFMQWWMDNFKTDPFSGNNGFSNGNSNNKQATSTTTPIRTTTPIKTTTTPVAKTSAQTTNRATTTQTSSTLHVASTSASPSLAQGTSVTLETFNSNSLTAFGSGFDYGSDNVIDSYASGCVHCFQKHLLRWYQYSLSSAQIKCRDWYHAYLLWCAPLKYSWK
jgi:hypothetical protein